MYIYNYENDTHISSWIFKNCTVFHENQSQSSFFCVGNIIYIAIVLDNILVNPKIS